MSHIFACERCGSKSFAHDEKACLIGFLTAERDRYKGFLDQIRIIADAYEHGNQAYGISQCLKWAKQALEGKEK